MMAQARNPRSSILTKYNPFSRLFFFWVDPLLWYGTKHTIQHKDLYAHPSEGDSKYLLRKFNNFWKDEVEKHERGGRASLVLALFKCIRWRLFLQAVVYVLVIPVSIGFALLLGAVTEYLVIEDPSSSDSTNAYWAATGMCLLAFLSAISIHLTSVMGYKNEMFLRIICTSAIYEKILSLSQATVNNVTVGHIINLISNDVHRFDYSLLSIPVLWTAPLLLICVTYTLYAEIGAVALIGIILTIGQMPLQLLLARLLTNLRLKAVKFTDERLKIMNEVITGIRVIKMYGWERAFQNLVSKIRKKEVNVIFRSTIVLAFYFSSFTTTLPVIMFVTFSTYSTIHGIDAVTPRQVFISLTLFAVVVNICNYIFVSNIIHLSEAFVAIKRIRRFLLVRTLPKENTKNEQIFCIVKEPLHLISDDTPCVIVKDVSCSWSNDPDKLSLKNVSFSVDKECPLIAVIGTVGSGKSTLLQCILSELRVTSGAVRMNGSLAYASQEPWIFSDTLRENILFGSTYLPDWYDDVVNMCALNKDINTFPDGDLTLIGERGVTLSGGQKARVGLARAVYQKCGIYLLDDPLSAVDAAVSRHIFERCIYGFLRLSSVVILVTHQTQYLQHCDSVLKLYEGSVQYWGKPIEFLSMNNEVIDTESEDQLLPGNQAALDNTFAKGKRTLNDQARNGSVSSLVEKELDKHPPEDTSAGSISLKVYYEYLKSGGGILHIFAILLTFTMAEVSLVFSDWWLASWTVRGSNSTDGFDLDTQSLIGIYAGLVGSVWIFSIGRVVLFYFLLLKASRHLHNNMFIAVIRSPILFFDTNPVGRILNRFSKDTGSLDGVLVYVFCEFLLLLTRVFAIVITVSIANYYLTIAVAMIGVVFLAMRWYLLKTAREIKRLEALARSPLYSHVSATIGGLPTIRAYNRQADALEKFHKYQNNHTQAAYLFIIISRWFGIRVDMILASFITLLVFVSLLLAESLDPTLVGLTLTYGILLLDSFQFCVRESADVENYMVSAERIIEYGKLPSEGELFTSDDSNATNAVKLPGQGWPDKGRIEITDLMYRHAPEYPYVLKGITCTIEPEEKVGIVGRTGAGKSSLVASFFRLAETKGAIVIDGVDCGSIGLHNLRPNLSIIPQDPVLFSGSIRYNLDPFNQYDDEKLWKALQQVQLSSTVGLIDGGLNGLVSEGGGNFSIGQRQLLCLARALLKQNKILLLDEATANVDMETDAIIQQVIRNQFAHCTVLTIAHRLDTVMDSDKIMVLNNGVLVEIGEPHELLGNSESYLLKLVESTGSETAIRLKNIACSYH